MAKARKTHRSEDFNLDVLSSDDDLFKWFLLCYLFGKPIRSETAVGTWQLFLNNGFDTPWAIAKASDKQLVRLLHSGGYTRYQHVTADGLKQCMAKLIDFYDGSLLLMLSSSEDQDEFSKRLRELYGVGPKIAEIFGNEVEEYFARRIE